MHRTDGSSLKDNFLLDELEACPFLRMLFVLDDWLYANVGGCRVEKPRWLRRVLRTVGLIGVGESGVRGRGDLAAAAETVFRVGTARASLGRAARASMSAVWIGL